MGQPKTQKPDIDLNAYNFQPNDDLIFDLAVNSKKTLYGDKWPISDET